MGWSKQSLIEEAFNELALQGYIFNVGPEEKQSALNRMDFMLAMWNGKGLRLGYPLPTDQDSSTLDQDSKLPDWALEAVYLNLAIRLAAGLGKTLTPTTLFAAKSAYNAIVTRMAFPPEVQLPGTMPLGAGNKPWRFDRTYFPVPTTPLLAGDDGPIEFD